MPDRFRITKGWAQRFAAEKISVPVGGAARLSIRPEGYQIRFSGYNR